MYASLGLNGLMPMKNTLQWHFDRQLLKIHKKTSSANWYQIFSGWLRLFICTTFSLFLLCRILMSKNESRFWNHHLMSIDTTINHSYTLSLKLEMLPFSFRTQHYCDCTWAPWLLRSPATRVRVQQLAPGNINETSKVRITGPLWRESTGDQWIPLPKGQ